MVIPPPDAEGVVWLESCVSTNDVAATLFDRPEVRAVVADSQTGGRGRRGRAWYSPPGAGLYMTWIARPRFGPERGGTLPLLAAVATAELCAALGARPMLRWPNDLLIGGRKLGGILCEARTRRAAWVAAVGIGLDLRAPAGGYPPGVPAIALREVAGSAPPARAVALRLLDRLTDWLRRAERDPAAVLSAWMALGPPPGARVRQGDLEGDYAGLAPDGGLRVRTLAGEQVLRAGEVEVVDWASDR